MQSPTQIRPRQSGFTLIELLTVIAIIGILAAIIIPTVSKVRASAKNAQCVAQLREWGRIIALYSNDNKGFYYTINWASAAPADAPLGHSYQDYYNTSKYEAYRMRYCPADPDTATLINSANDPRYSMVQGATQGSLTHFETESKTKPPAIPLSRAITPSLFMLMVDSIANSNVPLNAANISTQIQPLTTASLMAPLNAYTYEQRHGARFNAVFGDGSIKRVSFSSAAASLSDKTNLWAMKAVWLQLN